MLYNVPIDSTEDLLWCDFFTESTGGTEEQCMKLMLKLIDQLPPPNKKTLEALLRHLCL